MDQTVNYIVSDRGGKFRLTDGIDLVIPRRTFYRNTRVRVTVDEDADGIFFFFDTNRKKTLLPKKIALIATRQAVIGIKENYTLFFSGDPANPFDEPVAIEPVTTDIVVVWHIDDLSSYYLVR